MKLALTSHLAVAVALALGLGCGGSRSSHTGTPGASGEVAPAFPATRWVPASPSYVVAAPTFAAAQRGVRDAIDALGMFAGVTIQSAGAALGGLLGVDPLDPEAVSSIGIDVDGGVAVFSEDLAPTFVVRMAAPELFAAFLDRQRERGLISRSSIVDGVELFSATLVRDELDISWAIADGWLWIHFTPAFAKNEGTAWFTNSRKPADTAWGGDWAWAQAAAGSTSGLVGFIDPRDMLRSVSAKVPAALACVRLLEPVRRVGLAVEVAGGTAKGTLSFDVGAAATSIAAATLPQPEGFAAAAANAPLVAQWNLDLLALRGWMQPCLAVMKGDLKLLDRYGVRAGRALVQKLDPDDKAGVGAVSLDLVHRNFFAKLLDEVPGRSVLERDRRFGPLAGHTIAIPFVATVDYILNDRLAFLSMGDGLLGKVVGTGASVPGPIAAIDVLPPGLSPEAWRFLLEAAQLPESLADRLLRWREGHVTIAIDGTSLVVAASGTRR